MLLAVAMTAVAGMATLPEDVSAAVKPAAETVITNPLEVEKKVRAFFSDVPVMAEIAKCESGFRQFTDSGNPLRGGYGAGMIGVFQFYESIHIGAAAALGFNLSTLDGNLGYARHLYKMEGTNPWNSSQGCWQNAVKSKTTAKASLTSKERAALLAKITELTKLVVKLQKQLKEKQQLASRPR